MSGEWSHLAVLQFAHSLICLSKVYGLLNLIQINVTQCEHVEAPLDPLFKMSGRRLDRREAIKSRGEKSERCFDSIGFCTHLIIIKKPAMISLGIRT